MSNKLNHIEDLLKKISAEPDNDIRENDFSVTKLCLDSYIAYHNEAVSQGSQITLRKFHVSDEDEFMRYIENLHEHRKAMHKDMIDKTGVLNGLCEKYGLPAFYDGKLDLDRGRADDDTRYGVAELAETVCRDFFKVNERISVPGAAKQAYNGYISKVFGEGSSWDMLKTMIERADAKNAMDASQNPPEY